MPTLTEHPTGRAAKPASNKLPRIVLRCFSWSSGDGNYYAECVDLDISVRAKTPEQAIRELHDAMIGYLHVVVDGSHEGLIPRPAPLSHRMRYRWYCLLAAVSIKRHTLRLFDVPSDCPSFC
jgi:predicted RNase H-like HicB family nuclease